MFFAGGPRAADVKDMRPGLAPRMGGAPDGAVMQAVDGHGAGPRDDG